MARGASSRVTPLRSVDDDTYRIPPTNVLAEQNLIGSVFRAPAAYARVSDFLEPSHFSLPIHQRLWEAIGTLIERGNVANPITLFNLFEQDGALADIGGAQYLTDLANNVVSIINASDYARQIHDCYLRREIINFAEDELEAAYRHTLDEDAEDQLERAQERLYALSAKSITKADSGIRSAGIGAAEALARSETAYKGGTALSGLSTGLAALDALTGGLQKGSVNYTAGGPGSGKTVTAVGYILSVAALPGKIPLFFSMEMSRAEIGRRFLAALTGISVERQARGTLMERDFKELLEAQQVLDRSAILIDDTSGLTLGQLCQRARMQKRRKGLDLIVIDYIQLLRSLNRDGEERADNVKRAAFGIRDLAKELDVPIVALSQLRRSSREDKRPQLTDLRDAGELEESAGTVVMIYRRELVLKTAEPVRGPKESDLQFDDRHSKWSSALENSRGKVELLVEKNRFGETGIARCMLDTARGLFVDERGT